MTDERRNYRPYLWVIVAILGFIAGSLIGIGRDLRLIRDSMPLQVEASRDQ